MPRKLVQESDIIEMNELYKKLGTYAAVAREVGFSASTVSRYIKKDFIPQENINVIKFSGQILDINSIELPKNAEEWKQFLRLSEEELIGCKELQKEILI